MGYRRLFIMRKDLKMSAGKLAAQVGHCAEAYWTKIILSKIDNAYPVQDIKKEITNIAIPELSINKDIVERYLKGRFIKTICEARNKTHLLKAKNIAEDLGLIRGIDFDLIYDACYTELVPEEEDGTTLTGIWFRPLPDEVAHKISKKYQLYKG